MTVFRATQPTQPEQRARWQKGEAVCAEAYLRDHPALQADPNYALKLVYQEVLLPWMMLGS
jgi:hypothetical protein